MREQTSHSNLRRGFFRLWLVTLGISMLAATALAVDRWPNTESISHGWTVALVEAALEAEPVVFESGAKATPSQILASYADVADVELREGLRTKLEPDLVESIDARYVAMQQNLKASRRAMVFEYMGVTLAAFIAAWLLGELVAWVIRGFVGTRTIE